MSRTSLASAQAKCAGPAFSKCARRLRRRVAAPRVAGRGGSSRVGISVSIVVAASDRFSGGAPPPNRLDEQAARDRVFRLASETTGGRGAMEAIQGCLTSMPGMTNHRLMLFRHPSLKCPLDTVALNLVEPRWVVAFDAIANAPKRPWRSAVLLRNNAPRAGSPDDASGGRRRRAETRRRRFGVPGGRRVPRQQNRTHVRHEPRRWEGSKSNG
jgi:hypothetical protein